MCGPEPARGTRPPCRHQRVSPPGRSARPRDRRRGRPAISREQGRVSLRLASLHALLPGNMREDSDVIGRLELPSISPPAGPTVTSARRSPTAVGGNYRVSPNAGRAALRPAIFESGSVPRLRPRLGLRGFEGDGLPPAAKPRHATRVWRTAGRDPCCGTALHPCWRGSRRADSGRGGARSERPRGGALGSVHRGALITFRPVLNPDFGTGEMLVGLVDM